ncbi:MAG: glutamate synthase-related protein [Bacillota bacterium]|nr:glutamate synthase-related protein [Bacillota bacterium]
MSFGSLSPYPLEGGAPIIAQIGSWPFGYRDAEGHFSWEELKRKADLSQVKAFELKLAHGTKIRGGHLPGHKVTPEIAAIRRVPVGKTVENPNRFGQFEDVPTMMDFIQRIRQETGKGVGLKMVMGGPDSLDDLALHMARTGKGPDFITIDGAEGGSGATFEDMADTMGLPVKLALALAHNTLLRPGIRDRVVLIASGKPVTAMRSPAPFCLGGRCGADRGMMISVSYIRTLQCHLNTCSVRMATADPQLHDPGRRHLAPPGVEEAFPYPSPAGGAAPKGREKGSP